MNSIKSSGPFRKNSNHLWCTDTKNNENGLCTEIAFLKMCFSSIKTFLSELSVLHASHIFVNTEIHMHSSLFCLVSLYCVQFFFWKLILLLKLWHLPTYEEKVARSGIGWVSVVQFLNTTLTSSAALFLSRSKGAKHKHFCSSINFWRKKARHNSEARQNKLKYAWTHNCLINV